MLKVISYLEKALLLNFSIFLIFAPYYKRVVKVCFVIGAALWLLMNILKLKYRQRTDSIQEQSLFYRGFILSNPLNKPLLIFLAAAFLSTIFSLNFYHSQNIFFERYLPYAIFFWIGIYLVGNLNVKENGVESSTFKNLYFLIGAFILSGIIFGVGGVWDYFHYHPVRIWTVFGKEIAFKMFPLYLVYYIPLSFSLLLFSKKWFRFGGLFSLLLLVPCWIWQGSRSALVAILLSFFIILFIKKKKLILALVLVFTIGFFLLPEQKLERASPTYLSDAWGVRVELWRAAGNIFEDFPVFGAGLGMDEKLLYEYAPPESYSKRHGWRCGHVHNTYLEILSEMGIVGLLAFLSIFVVFFKNVFKTIRNATGNQQVILLGLTVAIIATLIFALSSSIITVGTQGSPMFWFLFGMASGLISKKL